MDPHKAVDYVASGKYDEEEEEKPSLLYQPIHSPQLVSTGDAFVYGMYNNLISFIDRKLFLPIEESESWQSFKEEHPRTAEFVMPEAGLVRSMRHRAKTITEEDIAASGMLTKGARMAGGLAMDLPFYISGAGIAKTAVNKILGKQVLGSVAKVMGKEATGSVLKHTAREAAELGITFAIADAAKESLREGATVGSIAHEGMKGGVIGAAIGTVGGPAKYLTADKGRMLRYTAPLGAEVTALTLAPAIMEGRMPKADEWVLNTMMLGTIKGIMATKGISEAFLRDQMHLEGEGYLKLNDTVDIPYGEATVELPAGKFIKGMKKLTPQETFEITTQMDWRNYQAMGKGDLVDRVWYATARRLVSPVHSTAIGIKRGVVDPTRITPITEVFPKAIDTLWKASGFERKVDFYKHFVGTKLDKNGKEIARTSADIKKMTMPEMEALHNKIIEENITDGTWTEIPMSRDRFGMIRNFQYFPKFKGKSKIGPEEAFARYNELTKLKAKLNKKGERLTKKQAAERRLMWRTVNTKPEPVEVMHPREIVRLSLLPQMGMLGYKFESPRYHLDGTQIQPDLVEGFFNYTMERDQIYKKIYDKTGYAEPNNKVISELIKAGGDVKAVENQGLKVSQADKNNYEMVKELYEYFATPENAWAIRITTPSGGIRKKANYQTAMQQAIGKEKEIRLRRKAGGFRTPMAGKQRNLPEGLPVMDLLKLYVNIALKNKHLSPSIARAKLRGKHLTGKKFDAAEEYIANIMNIQRDLLPMGAEKLTKQIASRIYVGALGFSPGGMLRNYTQLIPTAIEIGPKWLTKGIVQLWKDKPARERVKEIGVTEARMPEYMTSMEIKKPSPAKRVIDVVDEWAMWMFMSAEKVMRGSAYLGGHQKAMHYKDRLDLSGLREDARSLVERHWREGSWEKAADEYGKEAALKVHYGYSKGEAIPLLKTPGGRVGMQFFSYPGFTAENFIQTAINGNWKKTRNMLLSHPIAIAAGHPLGLSFAGFLGFGILPHLSPTAQFLIGLGEVIGGKTKEKRDRGARDMENIAWMMLPAGRMLHTKITSFVDTYRNDWNRVNPVSGEHEKTSKQEAFFRLLDLYPYAAAIEHKYKSKLAVQKADQSYVRGKAYNDYYNFIMFNRYGRKEKGQEYLDRAINGFTVTGGMPKYKDLMRSMQYRMQPKLMRMLQSNPKEAYKYLYSLAPSERELIMDMIDSRMIDMGSTPMY